VFLPKKARGLPAAGCTNSEKLRSGLDIGRPLKVFFHFIQGHAGSFYLFHLIKWHLKSAEFEN